MDIAAGEAGALLQALRLGAVGMGTAVFCLLLLQALMWLIAQLAPWLESHHWAKAAAVPPAESAPAGTVAGTENEAILREVVRAAVQAHRAAGRG